MQIAMLILLASIMIGGSALFGVHPAQAADVRTFADGFSGSSLDMEEWSASGTVAVGEGKLNLTNGNLYSTRWHSFGKFTIRMSMCFHITIQCILSI